MMRDYLVVDFEFTKYTKPVGKPRGFFPEILEIGAVKISGETLEVVGRIEHYVKPHFYPKQAAEGMEFSMISENDMKQAIEFSEMIALIRRFYIPNQTYFVAWGDADYGVLEEGCRRHKIENPVLLSDYLDMAEWYRWNMRDEKTSSLRKALEEQCIEVGVFRHTAGQDAADTGALLVQLLKAEWDAAEFLSDGTEAEPQ